MHLAMQHVELFGICADNVYVNWEKLADVSEVDATCWAEVYDWTKKEAGGKAVEGRDVQAVTQLSEMLFSEQDLEYLAQGIALDDANAQLEFIAEQQTRKNSAQNAKDRGQRLTNSLRVRHAALPMNPSMPNADKTVACFAQALGEQAIDLTKTMDRLPKSKKEKLTHEALCRKLEEGFAKSDNVLADLRKYYTTSVKGGAHDQRKQDVAQVQVH